MDFGQNFLLISDNHTKWHQKTPGMKGFEKSALSAKLYLYGHYKGLFGHYKGLFGHHKDLINQNRAL